MRRSLLVLTLLLAACGATVAPSKTPQPPQPRTETVQPGTSGPTAPAAVASGTPRKTQLPCVVVMGAWEQTAQMLDVLAHMDNDEVWAAALGPGSPVDLDPDALDGWIDQLASLPGQSDTIQVMRAVVPLYRAAVKSGRPFSDPSGVGVRLLEAARNASSLAGAEIRTALEVRGCEAV